MHLYHFAHHVCCDRVLHFHCLQYYQGVTPLHPRANFALDFPHVGSEAGGDFLGFGFPSIIVCSRIFSQLGLQTAF